MSFELILPFMRPIEPLLLDDNVSEIMGNPNSTWYAEREGRMERQPGRRFVHEVLRLDDYDRRTQQFQMEYVYRADERSTVEVIPC